MNIVLVGLNHHLAPVALRERVAVAADEKPRLAIELLDRGASEAVVISTCNRTEIVMRADDPEAAEVSAAKLLAERAGASAHEIEPLMFSARDLDAARHLFEVVTSLDSLVVGEPHIIGQVRDDLALAQKAGTVGKVLGRLFFRALTLTKSVRTQTALGESPVSVSSIALDMVHKVFGDMATRRALVLGAGEMGRQTAILAHHRGAFITVSSRKEARAREVAGRADGEVVPWEARREAMVQADIIVTSTGAEEFIIGHKEMVEVMQQRRNRPVFIIDIAVPRDVDPRVDAIYNLYRYDLDDLTAVAEENAEQRLGEIPKVRKMIDDALMSFEKWCRELQVVPDIVALREHVEEIRKSEVAAHLRKMHSLDDRDRNMVEALSIAIVNKVLHNPTVRLKDAAAEGMDKRHAGSLRYLFALDEIALDESDEET
jgi:glutamyl-tRNA reductase